MDDREGTNPTRGRRRRIATLAAALGLLVAVLGLGGIAGSIGADDEPVSGGLLFVIPAGAAAQVVAPGIDSAIQIPTAIQFNPGEPAAITIRNDDSVTHRAGPFLVGAGQTYTQSFRRPGTYPIVCTVDPSESIVVTVFG
jgi:hypothetical protein